MTTPECFAEEVSRRATVRLSQNRIRDESFRIGAIRFRVAGSNTNPARWLGRALFPDTEACVRETRDSHRLVFWDGIDAASSPPKRPWGPSDHMPLGIVTSFSNDNVRCGFDIQVNSLFVYDLASNTSSTWFPNIAELPAWALASPFRVPLSWLCNLNGMQIVHGGAVALEGRAVLLAGPGGAGKSTTALACVLAGLGYMGDDYCAVEPAAGNIHMVYRSAKLFKSSLEMLPVLATKVINSDRIADEKGVLYLDPDHAHLVPSAKLSAILLPHVGIGTKSNVAPATRAQAIKAILPSTVGGFMGGTAATARMILELVRSVPAFHLELGSDLDAVADIVATSLQRCN